MKIRNICFISSGYPSDYRVVNAFVETLVNAITDKGVQCVVISPQSVSHAIKYRGMILPERRERITSHGNKVIVYSPKYLSVSAKKIGFVNTAKITLRNFRNATEKIFRELNTTIPFDAIYGHFIFTSGITANYLGQKYNIPSFFAYGENTTYTIDYLGKKRTKELLQSIAGVISVSSENKRVLISNRIINKNKIGVFPNSIDTKLFFQKNKLEMRKKYGFPQESFIIAFVGRFLEVKGTNRLSKAIEGIADKNMCSIFIGEGPLQPTCDNIIYMGTMQHDKIADYLSAADIFVLPTLAEGCCNAILEAMACGLPIISSNRPFNDDILDDLCSIRVDPENINDIMNAIKLLRDNETIRSNMALAALKKSQQFTIENRSNNIVEFMEEKIENQKG